MIDWNLLQTAQRNFDFEVQYRISEIDSKIQLFTKLEKILKEVVQNFEELNKQNGGKHFLSGQHHVTLLAMLQFASQSKLLTLFQNGGQFKILLYAFKFASLTSFLSKTSFELSSQKRG